MAEAEYVDQRGENESANRRAMTSSQIRPKSESAFHSTNEIIKHGKSPNTVGAAGR
jgi:hypothetical protein